MSSNISNDSFVPMSMSVIDRDEQSFMKKRHFPSRDITLQGIETSNISWQVSGDISIFQSGSTENTQGKVLEKSPNKRGKRAESEGLELNTAEIYKRIKEGADPQQLVDELIARCSDVSARKSIPKKESKVANFSEDSFSPMGYSIIDRDEQSILKRGYVRSSDATLQGIESSNISWELDPCSISLYKSHAADKTLAKQNTTQMSETLALMNKIKSLPADISGTDAADLLLPPADGVSTKDRMRAHPSAAYFKVPTTAEIFQKIREGMSPGDLLQELLSHPVESIESRKLSPSHHEKRSPSPRRKPSPSYQGRCPSPRERPSYSHTARLSTRKSLPSSASKKVRSDGRSRRSNTNSTVL